MSKRKHTTISKNHQVVMDEIMEVYLKHIGRNGKPQQDMLADKQTLKALQDDLFDFLDERVSALVGLNDGALEMSFKTKEIDANGDPVYFILTQEEAHNTINRYGYPVIENGSVVFYGLLRIWIQNIDMVHSIPCTTHTAEDGRTSTYHHKQNIKLNS